MKQKIQYVSMIALVLAVSIAVVIIPTFFTKGVSRISLNRTIELPRILDDEKEIKLLFFGYSGCSDICTPRLYSLNKFYNALDDKSKKKVGIEFLDISVPADKTLPSRFAESFNHSFKGIYLDKNILRNYTKEFNVYFAQALGAKTEFNHTTNLYLLKKAKNKKQIRYIYNAYPYDFKQINLDIEELLGE